MQGIVSKTATEGVEGGFDTGDKEMFQNNSGGDDNDEVFSVKSKDEEEDEIIEQNEEINEARSISVEPNKVAGSFKDENFKPSLRVSHSAKNVKSLAKKEHEFRMQILGEEWALKKNLLQKQFEAAESEIEANNAKRDFFKTNAVVIVNE